MTPNIGTQMNRPLSCDNESSPLLKPTTGCPGLFRIVPALDGGICRIKLPLGIITSAQAIVVAHAARQFGNEQIEVTNRSNLQIRGVSDSNQAALIDNILGAGIGSDSPDSDDVRNVMVNPTVGIDQTYLLDTVPLAKQVLEALRTHNQFHLLSAKFSIYIDGGESIAHVEHPHDLWLSAINGDSFVMGFASSPILNEHRLPRLIVPVKDALDVIIAALENFIVIRRQTPEVTRLRHLRDNGKLNEFVETLRKQFPFLNEQRGVLPDGARNITFQSDCIGVHPQRQQGLVYIGAKPPLGRIRPDGLELAAYIATIIGDSTLRFTPWQSVIIPNVKPDHAQLALMKLTFAGLICEADDPLASMIACAGSTGCKSAYADTKADGLELAYMLNKEEIPVGIHLSGCAKSCASPSAAEISLVATSEDRYDVYVRQQIGQSGFGKIAIKNLTITQIADYLESSK